MVWGSYLPLFCRTILAWQDITICHDSHALRIEARRWGHKLQYCQLAIIYLDITCMLHRKLSVELRMLLQMLATTDWPISTHITMNLETRNAGL